MVTQTEMGTARIARMARIAPNPRTDVPKSIVATLGFRNQFLQSEQSEHFSGDLPTPDSDPLVRGFGVGEKVKN